MKMKRPLRKTPALFLFLLLLISCDSVDPEEPGITGRFSGPIPFTNQRLGQQVLSLVLTETGEIVSGNDVVSGSGILVLTLDDREIKYNFAVTGTVASSDFFLRWEYSITGIEDTFEGRIDSATNLSGVFRRGDLTAENVVLQRQ